MNIFNLPVICNVAGNFLLHLLIKKPCLIYYNLLHEWWTGKRCFSRIGFIGLGNIGSHMARNILKKVNYYIIIIL